MQLYYYIKLSYLMLLLKFSLYFKIIYILKTNLQCIKFLVLSIKILVRLLKIKMPLSIVT